MLRDSYSRKSGWRYQQRLRRDNINIYVFFFFFFLATRGNAAWRGEVRANYLFLHILSALVGMLHISRGEHPDSLRRFRVGSAISRSQRGKRKKKEIMEGMDCTFDVPCKGMMSCSTPTANPADKRR
jgi:hypothetical protein